MEIVYIIIAIPIVIGALVVRGYLTNKMNEGAKKVSDKFLTRVMM